MESKTNSSRLIIFASLLFGGLFFLYYPHLQNYSTTPKWIFAAVSGLVILFWGRQEKFVWSWGMSLWFGFVLLYLIQSLWSYNVWDSVLRTMPMMLAPLLVILLRREENDLRIFYSKTATVLAFIILPFVLHTLLELAGLYFADEYTHQSTYAFRYTFGNRNQYSEVLTLLIPLLAVGYFSAIEKWKKMLFALTVFLIYLAVTLLLNRAVFLVLFGVYPLIFLVFVLEKSKEKIRKIGFWILTFFVFGGIALLFSPARNKIPFLKNLLETDYGSGNERIRIWKNSYELWKESPVLGHGSGDWKIEILKTPLQFTQAEGSTVFFQRTHNDFIQIAVENGLLGLLLFLAFFGVSSFFLFKSALNRRMNIILFGGVLGYVVISNFSFPIEKIEALLLLFLFFLPGFSASKKEPAKRDFTKISLAILFVFTLFASVKWLNYEKNYFSYKGENDQLALSEIDKTKYTIDPTSTPLFWHEGNTFFNQQNYEAAINSYKKALVYNPYHVHVINNMGSSFYALKEIDEAEKYFNKALSFNPQFVETLMNYCSLEFNRGNIDNALVKLLSIPEKNEPKNYKTFVSAVFKAKYQEMIDKYDDPVFEKFLDETRNDDSFLYEISKKARLTGRSLEMELRAYLLKTTVQSTH